MFKRKLAKFLFLVIIICFFGAAQAHASSGGMDDELIYGYFSHRGAQNLMVVAEAVTSAPCTMTMPTGKKVFTYTPVEAPVVSCDPAKAKPIGVGSVAKGGNTLEVAVDIGPFEDPVDVSFGYFAASFDAADIYFLNIFDQVTSLQDELGAESTVQAAGNDQELKSYQKNSKKKLKKLIPWKSGVFEVEETLLGPIDLKNIPPGLYVLVLNVTRTSPADNNFDRFYRWVTYFIVPDPAE